MGQFKVDLSTLNEQTVQRAAELSVLTTPIFERYRNQELTMGEFVAEVTDLCETPYELFASSCLLAEQFMPAYQGFKAEKALKNFFNKL